MLDQKWFYQVNSNRRVAQKQRREAMLQEGITGKTVKDALTNASHPLHGKAEAMYFKGARDFLRTSLADNILCDHQDIANRFEGTKGKA